MKRLKTTVKRETDHTDDYRDMIKEHTHYYKETQNGHRQLQRHAKDTQIVQRDAKLLQKLSRKRSFVNVSMT